MDKSTSVSGAPSPCSPSLLHGFGLFATFSPPHLKLQVAPGAALLMRILEDFIHLIGEAQKPFQSFLVVTNNLSKLDSKSKVHVTG